MIENLDIDRLHNNISHIFDGTKYKLERGEGTTTGYLYLMLDEVLGGNDGNHYVYVGHSSEIVYHSFLELVKNEGKFYYSHQGEIYTINKMRFTFIRPTANPDRLRGMKIDRAFFDVKFETDYMDLYRMIHLIAYGDYV